METQIDKKKIEKGLYIVSTPIGNLSDITFRALEVLKNSHYVLCEDTRVVRKLLNFYNIKSNLISNHKFNEIKNLKKIREILRADKIISLVSDAGTPLVSDPGKIILEDCIKNNIKVIPIPGVSSPITAISVSGFSNNFYFHGFLSSKNSEAEKELTICSKLSCSIVFFLSAKKINKTIPLIKKYYNNRKIVICREMTKYFEQFIRTEVKNLKEFDENIKGEITIVISEETLVKNNSEKLTESDKNRIKMLINKLSIKDITEIISYENKVSKSHIYKYCLKLKNDK